jgi:hypothetical protein
MHPVSASNEPGGDYERATADRPPVIAYRLFSQEQALDSVRERVGRNEVLLGVHGERMTSLGRELMDVKQLTREGRDAIERVGRENQQANEKLARESREATDRIEQGSVRNLWALIIAATSVILTIVLTRLFLVPMHP